MRKPTEQWKPVLLRWKQSLPTCVRRLLRRHWLAKALQLADRGEDLIAKGKAYIAAAQQITDLTVPDEQPQGEPDDRS